MAGTYLPLAAILVAIAVTLLVATSAVPVAADKYSGRMVIIGAPGTRVVGDVSAGGAALNNNWQQQQRRRLVEDDVAAEFGGLLGAAGNDGSIGNDALDPNRAVCLPNAACAAKGPGSSHSRPCTYKNHCPH